MDNDPLVEKLLSPSFIFVQSIPGAGEITYQVTEPENAPPSLTVSVSGLAHTSLTLVLLDGVHEALRKIADIAEANAHKSKHLNIVNMEEIRA